MAVSASLTIPVNAATPARREAVGSVLTAALGASDIALDAVAGKAMLRFHFPGDIDPVMNELYRRGLTHSATVAISVRVDRSQGGTVSLAWVLERLGALPAVSNVSFDGSTIGATVAAATGAMRRLHDEIVTAGLTPVDATPRHRA
jgi:hypothetical protein